MGTSLEGRVAVITGAARGIGDAISASLIEEGARVFSLDMMDPEEVRAGVTYLKTDVTSPDSVSEAFATVDRDAGQLDILVSNAGIQRHGLVGKISYADFTAVIATHLNGLFLCASEAIPRMVKRGKGSIVSIASTAAFVGLPGRGPYCAAKAGILGLTRAMAVEVASTGVRVNAVAPGFTRTKFIDISLQNGSLREDWMVERVPMHRLADVTEIAKAVRFLASDESSYMTGQSVVVDGGWIVQGIPEAPEWLRTPAAT